MVATITDDTPLERQGDLKSLRQKNKFRIEQLRAKDIEAEEKRRRMKESWTTDWVAPWLDAWTASRGEFGVFGGVGQWPKRNGQFFPLYRSEGELALLRFPSRWLCATNSYAIGLVNGLTGYMIGSGLTYRVTTKKKEDAESNADLVAVLQSIVDDTLEANEWYGGELPGFEEEYFQRTVEDGEAIATHWLGADGMTQFRFAEPEQLTAPRGETNGEWSYGVKVDPKDAERPLAYNIAYDEAKQECEEFDPEHVTHFRRNVKRASKRGVPDFSHLSYESLDAAAKLIGNSGEAAAQQASIVAVMTHKTGTQSEIEAVAMGHDFNDWNPYSGQQIGVRKSRKGTTEHIPDSQSYTTGPAASNATAHLEILHALIRCGGVRWNAPDWLGSGNASGNTFANADASLTTFINRVIREQRRYCAAYKRMVWWAVEQFVRTVGKVGKSWEEIAAVIMLAVEAPNPVQKDPLADAQVAQIEIPLGVQSRQAYAQEMGRDWKQIENDNREWENDHGDIDPLTGQKLMNDEPGDDGGKPSDDSK